MQKLHEQPLILLERLEKNCSHWNCLKLLLQYFCTSLIHTRVNFKRKNPTLYLYPTSLPFLWPYNISSSIKFLRKTIVKLGTKSAHRIRWEKDFSPHEIYSIFDLFLLWLDFWKRMGTLKLFLIDKEENNWFVIRFFDVK